MQAASNGADDMPAICNLRALSPRVQQLISCGNRYELQVYEASCHPAEAHPPCTDAKTNNLSG